MSPTKQAAATGCKISEVPRSDLDQVIDLWSVAFSIAEADFVSGDVGTRERFRDFIADGIDYLVGAYDGGRIAAVAGVINFKSNLGGKWLDCGGIVGVATSPEYRRQRLVKGLLAKCVEQLDSQKFPISALWPFSYPFYEQMGYAVTDFRYRIDVSLPTLRKIKGNALAYRTVPLLNYEPAAAVHEKWVEGFNTGMKRSEKRWERLLTDPRSRKRLFVHADGYMLWNLTGSVEKRLELTEWCCTTPEAFLDGLALLAQMDSQFERARWLSHEVDSFMCYVGPDKSHQIELLPGMMSRVVHLPSFMSAISAPADIVIDDPLDLSGSGKGGVDPGHLMQHVLGARQRSSPVELPESLRGCVGKLPSLCIEQY